VASKPLLTLTEYDAFVDALALDARVPELLNGDIVVAARLSRLHMRYAQAVFKMIDAYVDAHQVAGEILTEFEVALDDYSILIPDLAFVLEGSTLGQMTDDRLYGAPDLVVEIASPSTRDYDARDKFLAYLRAGVQEYWIVDPHQPPGQRFTLFERVVASRLPGRARYAPITGGLSASRIFPGITCDPKLL
jgi:Uma2 family endonuclease